MEYLTFDDFKARIQELYQQEDYQTALEFATQQSGRFPEYDHLVSYWRMAMAARTGNPDLAMSILEDVLESGFWYGEPLLRRSPSFQSIQGMPRFERLAKINRRLQEADPTHTYPLITLRAQNRCQAGGLPCPALVALHANGTMAQYSVEFWSPAAAAGWLVAVPQSSQAMWKGAYRWDDRETAEQEIKKHFASLAEQYAVDPNRVVLAGQDMGGEVAIMLALNGAIPACGFVVFGPSGPWMTDPDHWTGLIQDNQNPGLRGYVIVGQEDESINLEGVEGLVEMLNEAGIPCDLEAVPHAGREFAPEYESSLLRALNFVLEK